MNTLVNYLETMFAQLPRNAQTWKLKEDLLATMEEKYNELKAEGRSENEAVGIVISEFGNIDELMQELEMTPLAAETQPRVLTSHEVEDYLQMRRRSAFNVALGVGIIIFGVALMMLINILLGEGGSFINLSETRVAMISMVALFACVVPGIALFGYNSSKNEPKEYMQREFQLPNALWDEINQRKAAFMPTYKLVISLGVVICVFSPVLIFVPMIINEDASGYGVTAMLLAVAVAVFLFIYWGNIKESYSIVLQTDDFAPEKKEENRAVAAINAIVWPIATIAFLIGGFIYNLWHIAWIVFPITGVLSGALSKVNGIMQKEH
ncbi:permease prefix domain 1-containing protein [Paenibacillus sp. CAU 1782]